ncbi:MAG TPA: response regulator [Bacteroidales bacterium]|jgi:DNA-binding response OmpR family regulator|nr:response regulator [Bacteroidales bacterium]
MSLNFSSLALTDKTIAIVEDDVPSLRYYETLLLSTGAGVVKFRTGKDFVEHIRNKETKIDLVIMDFLIPLINGIDCTRIFRKERKGVPVLMITAYSSEQSKADAYIAGCNEYILKPVYPEKVYALLEKYLKQETYSAVNQRS